MRGNVRSLLRAITILSDENLDWEIMMFSSDTFDDTDPDADDMIGVSLCLSWMMTTVVKSTSR